MAFVILRICTVERIKHIYKKYMTKLPIFHDYVLLSSRCSGKNAEERMKKRMDPIQMKPNSHPNKNKACKKNRFFIVIFGFLAMISEG